MNREEILKKLEEIFCDIFNTDDIELSEETCQDDIEGWDSLTHISILEAVQDDLQISFSLDEIIEMKNVSDIINCIQNKL